MLEDTNDAAASADALLFCLSKSLMSSDREAAETFADHRDLAGLSGRTAIGVLTKIDHPTGPTPDLGAAMVQAEQFAQRWSRAYAGHFSAVLPVAGLLAETALTGALREQHARTLSALAQTWEDEDIRFATRGLNVPDSVIPSEVSREQLHQLMLLLGKAAVAEMLKRIRDGYPADAASLTRLALDLSGFRELDDYVTQVFYRRAGVLKAATVLGKLREQAKQAGDYQVLGSAIDLLDRPELFPLRVIGIGRVLAQGSVRPPPGLIEQAWTAVQSGLAPMSNREAIRDTRAWRSWSNVTDSAGQAVARVMVRAIQRAAAGEV